MKEKERIAWIDIAKGIGIVLVVLGHCVVKTDYAHKFIFSFHMPLFLALSGYCFHVTKYDSFKEVVLKRGKALLVPYFEFVIFGLVITLLVPGWRQALTLKSIAIDMYQGYPASVHVTSIWFLVSLYVISLTYYIMCLISRKVNKKYILYIGVALSGFLGYMVYVVKSLVGVGDNKEAANMILPGGRLPLTVDASMMALVFFAVGVWLYEKDLLHEVKHRWACVVIGMLLTVIIGVFFNERVNIHGCTYGNPIFFMAAALGGTIMVIAFSQIICSYENYAINKIKDILIFYGKHSLYMMGAQSLFINLYVYFINEYNGTDYVLYENLPTNYGVFGFIVITIVCLPVSYAVSMKVKKWVVGKNG